MRRLLSSILLVVLVSALSFADDDHTPLPYGKNEFPQWSKDFRRAEIISLGALPFVSITATMVFGGVLLATGQSSSFPNPFDKSGEAYTEGQTLAIVGISLSASVLIGIVDYSINVSKRHRQKMREKRLLEQNAIFIEQTEPEDAEDGNNVKEDE